jgi:hypothetical protein
MPRLAPVTSAFLPDRSKRVALRMSILLGLAGLPSLAD